MGAYISTSDSLRSFLIRVFGWMSVGLGVTSFTAWYIFYKNPAILMYLMQSTFLLITLFIVQLGLVFWISSRIFTLSPSTAIGLFLSYALLNGVIFSGIFFTYTQESIATTFGIAAGMFALMALFGFFTRINLTPIGTFGFMTLWGLIISMLANAYFQSQAASTFISGIGVVLFAALTAYDMQRLTVLAHQLQDDEQRSKVAIFGALMLYLDFINLFLMLLSFTGKRRD